MTTESTTLYSPSIRLCTISTSFSVKGDGPYTKITMSRIIIDIIIPILGVLLISHIFLNAPENEGVHPGERIVIKTCLELEDEDQL